MQWPFKILVLFVLTGIAFPVIRRMRAIAAVRAAFAHEPLPVRVAALAFLIASVIYGGGKTNGLDRTGGMVGGDLRAPRDSQPSPDPAGRSEFAPYLLRDGFALPGWFALAGYDAADTDGDGIPDCWERWTGTNPLVVDSSLDLDGDGLPNLDEFTFQIDPQFADTDNDGLSDASEVAGLLAGVADFDPLAPATYVAQEPDVDTNGVPDIWEYDSASLFTEVDLYGFPAGCNVADPDGGNYDVSLTVSSSRFALLSWGDEEGDAVLLPPCTNLAFRLRLDAAATRTVSLSAVPDGAPQGALLGNWMAVMSAAWDARRDLPTDGDRVQVGDGTMVDRLADAVAYRGAVVVAGEPPLLRGGSGGTGEGGPLTISFIPHPWSMMLRVWPGCWEHDGGSLVTLEAEDAPPPYVWSCGDNIGDLTTNQFLYVPFNEFHGEITVPVEVRCEDGIHSNLVIGASVDVTITHCREGATNIVSIYTLPDYDVITNHTPKTEPYTLVNGGGCPDGEGLMIYAGWKHGGDLLERNFETIPTGDDADDLSSHCIAIDWTANLEIDLEDYLPGLLMPHKDELRYRVNGDIIDGSTITVKKDEPEDLFPEIYHVEMCKEDDTVLDGLWIMVMSPQTSTEFETWVSNNATNADWLAQLPKPPSKILVDASGNASLPSEASANWNAPELFPTNSYMHPKAVYELRSIPISGGHGHQATYDANGNIITTSIKAGTADFASPSFSFIHGWHPVSHREDDVKPYIRALQLDGNPVFPINLSGEKSSFWTRNLSRPPLRVGSCTQQYLDRRPTTPTGILNIQ